MNRRRAPALLLGLWASALGGCGSAVSEGSKRLPVEAPGWWFSHLPVPIEAIPSGALAGQEATLTVAVGANVAGRFETAGGPTTIRIPGVFFATGSNLVSVKTGSERSTVTVQVVSVVWLAMLIAISLALAVALVSRWRQRRAG